MKGEREQKKFEFLSRPCHRLPALSIKASLTNVRQNMSSDNSFSRKCFKFLTLCALSIEYNICKNKMSAEFFIQ